MARIWDEVVRAPSSNPYAAHAAAVTTTATASAAAASGSGHGLRNRAALHIIFVLADVDAGWEKGFALPKARGTTCGCGST